MRSGYFFSFEGGEGTGKTTVVNYLVQRLTREGYDVVLKREPGGTLISEKIRSITHDVQLTEMDARTEALLMAASRAQLVAEGYVPALSQGEVVLADRYIDSTYAYQGYGRGLPLDELRRINHFATDGLLPDKTFLFDVDPLVGKRRRVADGREDRIELENDAFFDRVRQGYLELARQEPDRFVVVDADRPLKQVGEEVCEYILHLIARQGRLPL